MMRLFALVAALCLFAAPMFACGAEPPGCLCGPGCQCAGVEVTGQPTVFDYAGGQAESRRTGIPLVTWIGFTHPTPIPGTITATAPIEIARQLGQSQRCVYVSTWVGDLSVGLRWDGTESIHAVAGRLRQPVACPDGRCPNCPR